MHRRKTIGYSAFFHTGHSLVRYGNTGAQISASYREDVLRHSCLFDKTCVPLEAPQAQLLREFPSLVAQAKSTRASLYLSSRAYITDAISDSFYYQDTVRDKGEPFWRDQQSCSSSRFSGVQSTDATDARHSLIDTIMQRSIFWP